MRMRKGMREGVRAFMRLLQGGGGGACRQGHREHGPSVEEGDGRVVVVLQALAVARIHHRAVANLRRVDDVVAVLRVGRRSGGGQAEQDAREQAE